MVCEGDRLTYRELDGRANRLAHHLRSEGIVPDQIVAVCLGRSAEGIVALLAVLKAGAAYLPMDPSYPDERLRLMLDDAQPSHVITTAALAERIGGGNALLTRLDADGPRISSHPNTAPPLSAPRLSPRLLYLHIRVDGTAERCPSRGPQRRSAAGKRSLAIRLRRVRRLDDVPFTRLRFLGLGNVRRAPLRRTTDHRPGAGGKGPGSLRRPHRPGAGDRPEPDSERVFQRNAPAPWPASVRTSASDM